MRDLRHLAIAATAGLVLAAPAAHADILTASSFGSPDLLTLGVGSTLVANTGVQLFANSKYSGSAQEWVWEDTNSTFGKDDLTFVISVANNNTSTDLLGRITAGDFAGFLTDVGDNGGANGPKSGYPQLGGGRHRIPLPYRLGSRRHLGSPHDRHQRDALQSRHSRGNRLGDPKLEWLRAGDS